MCTYKYIYKYIVYSRIYKRKIVTKCSSKGKGSERNIFGKSKWFVYFSYKKKYKSYYTIIYIMLLLYMHAPIYNLAQHGWGGYNI